MYITGDGGLSLEKTITIDVRYRNKPPYKIKLSSLRIDENQKEGTLVAYLNTSDLDETELHSYTLEDYTNFPDNLNFEIVKNELRTKRQFDFEKKINTKYKLELLISEDYIMKLILKF